MSRTRDPRVLPQLQAFIWAKRDEDRPVTVRQIQAHFGLTRPKSPSRATVYLWLDKLTSDGWLDEHRRPRRAPAEQMHLLLLDVPAHAGVEGKVRGILGRPDVVEAIEITGVFNLLVRARTDDVAVLRSLTERLIQAGVRDARMLTASTS